MLERVQVLDVHCYNIVDKGVDSLFDDILQLAHLPNVKHLYINDANWDVDANMQVLED
jgi:hypothetical protein